MREKTVHSAAKQIVIAVEANKFVSTFSWPVPVETHPFAIHIVRKKLEDIGVKPKMRMLKEGYPYVTENGRWMVEHGVKCVGIDTASVEQYGLKDAPLHKKLLSSNIGIIENLANLKQFVGSRMFFVCLPLPLKGLDGSPARAVLLDIVK